jgi:hypothetical protein
VVLTVLADDVEESAGGSDNTESTNENLEVVAGLGKRLARTVSTKGDVV